MVTAILIAGKMHLTADLPGGVKGLCIDCGARMHTQVSRNGVHYAALCPNEKHTSEFCRAGEKKDKVYLPEMTTIDRFFLALTHVPEERPKKQKIEFTAASAPTAEDALHSTKSSEIAITTVAEAVTSVKAGLDVFATDVESEPVFPCQAMACDTSSATCVIPFAEIHDEVVEQTFTAGVLSADISADIVDNFDITYSIDETNISEKLTVLTTKAVETLQNLVACGAMGQPPDYVIWDRQLWQLLVIPSWLSYYTPHNVMENAINITDKKIIFIPYNEKARFTINESKLSVIVTLRWNDWRLHEIYHLNLVIYMSNQKSFKQFTSKYLTSTIAENGTLKYNLKEKNGLLLAGYWSQYPCSEEDCAIKERYGCDRCRGRIQTVYGSSKQVMLKPENMTFVTRGRRYCS